MTDGARLRDGRRGHRDARRLHGRNLTTCPTPASTFPRRSRAASRSRCASDPPSDGDRLSHRRRRQGDSAQRRSATFTCRYNGELVFAARLSSGIAANPYLRFFVTARARGELSFEWVDDAGVRGYRARRRRTSPDAARARCRWPRAPRRSPRIAQERPIAVARLRSGITFAGADVRAMQADDIANPGIAVGAARRARSVADESCASCHGDARVDARRGGALSRVRSRRRNRCSTSRRASTNAARERQHKPAFGRESDDSLALGDLRRATSRAACRSPCRSTGPRAQRSSAAQRSTRSGTAR